MSETASVGLLFSEWREPTVGTAHMLTHPLAPLLGKPLLQRSLEQLVQLGCKTVHVFLGPSPAPVQALLGNGERWGIQVAYHYFQDERSLGSNLSRLPLDPAQRLWLVCDDQVIVDQPVLAPNGLVHRESNGVVFGWMEGHTRHWAGLACVPFAGLKELDSVMTRQALAEQLLNDPSLEQRTTGQPLDGGSDAAFLHSAKRLLDAQGGMQMGRGAIVHPLAVLTEPVFLGHQVRIGPYARIGPHAVIEDRSVIDNGTVVRCAVVLPDTYVGRGLNVIDSVVQAGVMSNVAQGVLLPALDPILLAPVHVLPTLAKPGWRTQLGLMGLQLLLWPIHRLARRRLTTAHAPAPSQQRLQAPLASGASGQTQMLAVADTLTHLYAQGEQALLTHFVATFYPGLAEARQGRLALWGPDVRSAQDVRQLPAHWQALYLQHRAGLLNPAVHQAAHGVSTDRYLSDLSAVVDTAAGPRLRQLAAYLGRVTASL